MVTKTKLTINNNEFECYESNLTCNWVMIYSHFGKVLRCESVKDNSGKSFLRSINPIFEGKSKEHCKEEAKRLKLYNFPE